MKTRIKVDKEVLILKTEKVGTNSVNTIECEFDLSEEFDKLTPIAIFTKDNKSYKVNIIDNKCVVPQEVLQEEGMVSIGVYGFILDGEKLVKRYSPIPTEFVVREGSYKEGEESVDASPNSFEYYLTECKKIKESMGSGTGTGTSNYTELNNKPKINNVELTGNKTLEELGINIPTKTSELNNDSGFLTEHQDISGKVNKVEGKGLSANDFTTEEKNKLSNLVNYDDTDLKNKINNKQDKLTSGSNIKTINGNSILGEGNIEIKGTEGITSTAITSIQVVDSLPEIEETGVLYLVKEGTTPAVVNLYPTQNSITNTENGCTITHNNKQVTINGTPTSSMWGWTNHFTMPLESGKNYTLKLTNVSGNFDNSGRIAAGSDDVVIKVLIYAYLADNTEVALVNKELTDTTIYNAQQFLCGDTYKDYYFSIQAKSNVAFSNLVLDVSITEV